MRRRALMQSVAVTILLVVLASAPGLAALRDGYLGDVAVIAWLEGNVVKVALANESTTRKSVTIASEGWDQSWRPFFLDRTVVLPARTVLIEAFNLTSAWRGEPCQSMSAPGIVLLLLRFRPRRSSAPMPT